MGEVGLPSGGSTNTTAAGSEARTGGSRDLPVTVGNVLAGRYEVRRLLGRGGMGVVFAAYDRALREHVAVKILRPELAGERRWAERLAREVKLARQIHHPNVCRVFDFVQADGEVFIVMELAQRSLRAERASAGGGDSGAEGPRRQDRSGDPTDLEPPPREANDHLRPLDERLKDARSIVEGLAAIHEAGIVHRDINLQNVLRLADGRLVVSDFGLAVDVEETGASFWGGTVAYMAPELAVGRQASFVSDVWALGIVLYEVTFGQRPRFRDDLWTGLRPPSRLETGVATTMFEICRACTAPAAAERPPSGGAVMRLLERLDVSSSRRRRVRSAAVATLVLAALASVVGGHRLWLARRHAPRETSWPGRTNGEIAPNDIAITGILQDWTTSSRVLATVDGHVHCLMALPDEHTLRFVWGIPRHAEDVDVRTGKRRSSGLVPEVYAEGCPALSPDRKAMIFQGYDASHHGAILVSTKPDGSEARPVVSASEPWVSGDPLWVGKTQAFAFNIDHTSVGVFDLETSRTTVVPDNCEAVNDCGWTVVGDNIYTGAAGAGFSLTMRAFSWPSLIPVSSFEIRKLVTYCASDDPAVLYCAVWGSDGLIKITPASHRAERVGSVRDHEIGNLAPMRGGMAFIAEHYQHDAWQTLPDGRRNRLTDDGRAEDVTRCGLNDYLLSSRKPTSERQIVRLLPDGRRQIMTSGPHDVAPNCSRTSGEWWFSRQHADKAGLYSCRDFECQRLVSGTIYRAALAPDEKRLAFVLLTRRGLRLQWIDSHGGGVHDVADTAGFCQIGWATNRSVWAMKKQPGGLSWIETDIDTGQPTGRSAPSASDCGDTDPDPLSPISPDLQIVAKRVSQLRVQMLP